MGKELSLFLSSPSESVRSDPTDGNRMILLIVARRSLRVVIENDEVNRLHLLGAERMQVEND